VSLDVAVDYAFRVQVTQSLVDIPDYRPGFELAKTSLLGQSVAQSATLAEFGEAEALLGGLEDVVALDDVGMVQGEQGLDFVFEKFHHFLVTVVCEIDDLGGNLLFWIGFNLRVIFDIPSKTVA
jgi:hypothetical protein